MGRRTIVNLLIALIAFGALFLLPQKSLAAEKHDVIFYEIAWAGSSRSQDPQSDEWLVLKNRTKSLITVDGWRITKFSSNQEKILIDLKGEIPGDGYYLISHFDRDNSILDIYPDLKVEKDDGSSFSLSNTTFQLKLYKSDTDLSEVNIIDIAGNKGKPLAGSNGKPKASMVRGWPIKNGDQEDAWFTNYSRFNLDSDAKEFATPKVGVPNVTLENWPEFGLVGEYFASRITMFNPDEVAVSLEEDDLVLANDLPSDKTVDVKLFCSKNGVSNVNAVKIINEKRAIFPIGQELFCYQFADLIINEVYPAPQSEEKEWVEIYNPTEIDINLERWMFKDRSSDIYTFSAQQVVPARGYLQIFPSDISLNNDGDELELLSPAEEVVDLAEWGKAKKGNSWSKFDDNFKWTLQPTPTAANILKEESDDEGNIEEDEDNGSATGSESDSSSGGRAKAKNIITTKKVLGGEKLLAVALYSSSLPKINATSQSNQNSSPLSPLSPTNKILVEAALGSMGLLALARVGLTVVSLLL